MAKKKKKKTLLLLCLIMVILLGGYAGLRVYNEKAESEDTAASEEAEEAESLVTLDGEAKTLSYTKDGVTLEMVHEDDAWKKADDADFPLNTTKISTLITNIQNAEVEQVINEDGSNLEEYGLDDPVNRITVTMEDGSETTILVGDTNTMVGGTYAMVEGTDRVVLTTDALNTAFESDWYQMVNLETIPEISESDLEQITVERGGSSEEAAVPADSYVLTYFPYGADAYDATGNCNLFLQTEDGYQTLSEDTEADLLDAVTGWSYEGMTVYDPSEEELASYGLDAPQMTITCDYTEEIEVASEDEESSEDTEDSDEEEETVTVTEEKSFLLYVGAYDDTLDSYYVQPEGSKAVYTMSADQVSSFLNLDGETEVYLNPAAIPEDTVDTLDITVDGTTVTYGIERDVPVETEEAEDSEDADAAADEDADSEDADAAADEDADSEDADTAADETETLADGGDVESEPETTTIYTKDGEEIEASEFNDIYTAVTDLEGSRRLEESEVLEGEPQIVITFHRNQETNLSVSISLYAWNDNCYQLAVNDEAPSMTVDIGLVKDLLGLLE